MNGDEAVYLDESDAIKVCGLFSYCENEPISQYDPSGFYVIYIYGKDQKRSAHINCKRLRKKFLVYDFLVANQQEFTRIWNEYGTNRSGKLAKIDIVIVNLHGNPYNVECVDFGSLRSRKIDTFLLLSCNAGHQSYPYTNPAYKFFRRNDIRQMVCCDGTHYRRNILDSRVEHSVEGDSTYTGLILRGKRKSRGFLVYKRYPEFRRISIHSIGYRFNSIEKLLMKIGKW